MSTEGSRTAPRPSAHVARRAAALALDLGVSFVLADVFAGLLSLPVARMVITLWLGMASLRLMEALTGVTPGKAAMGLRVVAPSLLRRTIRSFLRLLIAPLIASVSIPFNARRRALYDILTGCDVEARPVRLPLLRGLGVMLLGVYLWAGWFAAFVGRGVEERLQAGRHDVIVTERLSPRRVDARERVWAFDESFEVPTEIDGMPMVPRGLFVAYDAPATADGSTRRVVLTAFPGTDPLAFLRDIAAAPVMGTAQMSPRETLRLIAGARTWRLPWINPRAALRSAMAVSARRCSQDETTTFVRHLETDDRSILWTRRTMTEWPGSWADALVVADDTHAGTVVVTWRGVEPDDEVVRVFVASVRFEGRSPALLEASRAKASDGSMLGAFQAFLIGERSLDDAVVLHDLLMAGSSTDQRRDFVRGAARSKDPRVRELGEKARVEWGVVLEPAKREVESPTRAPDSSASPLWATPPDGREG